MLHDFYLLSTYFEPAQAVMYEDDVKRRYDSNAIAQAMTEGWLDLYRAPCLRGDAKCFYRLSQKGMQVVQARAL